MGQIASAPEPGPHGRQASVLQLPLLGLAGADLQAGSVPVQGLIVSGVGGRRVFRLLIPQVCPHACVGCPSRAQQSLPSTSTGVMRLAHLFLSAFRRGRCDGLFVTAGLPSDPITASERMLELISLLRIRLGYRGYLHAKVPPGATRVQTERLSRLVDRISHLPERECGKMAEGIAAQGDMQVKGWTDTRPMSSLRG